MVKINDEIKELSYLTTAIISLILALIIDWLAHGFDSISYLIFLFTLFIAACVLTFLIIYSGVYLFLDKIIYRKRE